MIKDFLARLFGRKSDRNDGSITGLNLPNVADIPSAPAPTYTPPPPPDPDEARQWVRDHIARDVAGGFRTPDEIIEDVPEIFEGELPQGELEALAREEVPKAVERFRAEQADWPEVTDNDRLQQAITALADKGIVFRENFSCCGTCGSAEIWDEMDDEREAGKPVRGYAFYHMQDTESAVEGGGLYLNYGSTEEGEGPALDVAREIESELKAQGLNTHWDGTWNQRIGFDIDWKRRISAAL